MTCAIFACARVRACVSRAGEDELEKALLQAVLQQYEALQLGHGASFGCSPASISAASPQSPAPLTASRTTGTSLPVSRSLKLAVQWARVDVMRDVVDKILSQPSRYQAMQQLKWAMQTSLEAKRAPIVALLLESDAVSLADVDVCSLYAHCDGGAHSTGMSETLRAFQQMPHNLRKLSASRKIALFREHVLSLIEGTHAATEDAPQTRDEPTEWPNLLPHAL